MVMIRLTKKEYQHLMDEPEHKNNKYHAHKVKVDGITFDSKHEADRYQELKLLQKANEIYDLQRQVPYMLIEKSEYGREIRYIADFVYRKGLNEVVVEDAKGVRTKEYKLKKRLMAEKYGIIILET